MNNKISEEDFNNITNNAKLLIDPNIYKFLFKLLYAIFFKIEKNNNRYFAQLETEIKYINKKFIKKGNEINCEYNNKNLKNIINFVISQNKLYAGNILENILIVLFSFVFNIGKEKTFGKYLYNNIRVLSEETNELVNWAKEKASSNLIKEISDLKSLLEDDIEVNTAKRDSLHKSKIQQKPLYEFLSSIFLKKFKNHHFKTIFLYYINNGIINFDEKKTQKLALEKKGPKSIDIEELMTQSNLDIISNIKYSNFKNIDGQMVYVAIGKAKKRDIKLIRSLLISVYIYYQIKNSPLMKNRKHNENNEDDNLQIIPFKYDLSEAAIESNFAGLIFSPLRVEPNVAEIIFTRNDMRDNGFKECSLALLFNNKNIKKIDFKKSSVKSFHIDFLNYQLGIFDNNSVEVLNLNSNHLKNDCKEYLPNILSHFKNLKRINVSSNPLKRGISSFIIMLKKLYREGKTNLETLNLNQCELDDISFYELGELLKSKYCILKNLYLNQNNIPSCSNFLKKLKRNKSLKALYINSSNIGNNDTNDVNNIISNSNIKDLYLYKNYIIDFSQCLRILYRTKLVSRNGEKNDDKLVVGAPHLSNLDLSKNDCFNKNIDKVKLFKDGIKETTLDCLDFSGVLFGKDPKKMTINEFNYDYMEKIDALKQNFETEKNEYIKNIRDINNYNIDIQKLNEVVQKDLFKKEGDDLLNKIINDINSKHMIFLKKQAKKIIEENNNILNININNDNKKEVQKKIVDYISLKRAEKIIEELQEKKNKKKLIII